MTAGRPPRTAISSPPRSPPSRSTRGEWVPWTEHPTDYHPGRDEFGRQPILADFNGDGELDLVIPEADGVTVFPNPGDGHFVQANGIFTQSVGSVIGLNLVAGDFNNDGKIDLISSRTTSR